MTPWWLLAVTAGAGAYRLAAPRGADRLAALQVVANVRDRTSRPEVPAGHGFSPMATSVCTIAAALTLVLVVPGPAGWLLAVVAAPLLRGWLARQPSRREVQLAAVRQRQLPSALELLSAALAGGGTTAAAVRVAAEGAGPPLAAPLLEVVRSLRLGAPAEEAWRPASAYPELSGLARLAVRSSSSGAALAAACRELAGHERARSRAQAQVAVKRAGVVAVLPLGLCFLPAFVLVGVVPVVVGLLSSLTL